MAGFGSCRFYRRTCCYDNGMDSATGTNWIHRNTKAASRRPLYGRSGRFLSLRELLTAARLVEANLLSLDFPGVACHETRLRQRRLQLTVVVDQGTGDSVAH